MPLIDDLRDRVTRILPPKKETIPIAASGGVVPFEEDMIISKPAIVFHAIEIFFQFLAMCCFAATAAFEARFGIGPSAITNFGIFIAVSTIVLSSVMLAVPVIYDRHDKLVRLARAMREVRVSFILAGTGTVALLVGSFALTISAWTQAGCKDPKSDANAKLGDDFLNGLPGFCQTKQAGAVFFWLAFLGWVATFAFAFMEWRNGRINRPRDPPFTRPVETHEEDHEPEDPYSPVRDRPGAGDLPGRQTPDDEETAAPSSPFGDEHRYAGPPAGRPSTDAYGAFDDPPPSGYGDGPPPGISRTMAYADPYAALRANLANSKAGAGQSSYTGYTGYR